MPRQLFTPFHYAAAADDTLYLRHAAAAEAYAADEDAAIIYAGIRHCRAFRHYAAAAADERRFTLILLC